MELKDQISPFQERSFWVHNQKILPDRGTGIVEQERYTGELKKDQIARFLMMSCMPYEIVHLFEIIKSAKGMWDSLKKKYDMLFSTWLWVMKLKVNKIECSNTKGIEKASIDYKLHFL